MPVGIGGEKGWWCPSLDDAGNGTTTLSDLSGFGANGTLTQNAAPNMGAGDWVADTSSGGVRCLQLDNTKFVTIPFTGFNSKTLITFSIWLKRRVSAASVHAGASRSGATTVFGVQRYNDGISYSNATGSGTLAYGYASSAGTSWCHTLIEYDGSKTGNARLTLWLDGVATAMTYVGSQPTSLYSSWTVLDIGRNRYGASTIEYSDGRFDDCRVFERLLSSTEKTALASKRGYQPSTSRRKSAQPSIRSTF